MKKIVLSLAVAALVRPFCAAADTQRSLECLIDEKDLKTVTGVIYTFSTRGSTGIGLTWNLSPTIVGTGGSTLYRRRISPEELDAYGLTAQGEARIASSGNSKMTYVVKCEIHSKQTAAIVGEDDLAAAVSWMDQTLAAARLQQLGIAQDKDKINDFIQSQIERLKGN